MIRKKDLIVAVLAAFCLTATVFFAIPSRSQSGTGSSSNYNPLADLNHDGVVDIYDAVLFAQAYGSSGDPTLPVNVTNWPSPSYAITEFTLNMSEGSAYSSPLIYCGGYSTLSLMINATGTNNALGGEVNIYLDQVLWFSDASTTSCILNDSIFTNIFNLQTPSTSYGTPFSLDSGSGFITETEGPYCMLWLQFFSSSTVNWATINYCVYLRNQ